MVDQSTSTPEQLIINGEMFVATQPKPDQRARYASDGHRYLPDSKKHPITVKVCI